MSNRKKFDEPVDEKSRIAQLEKKVEDLQREVKRPRERTKEEIEQERYCLEVMYF